MLPNRSKQVKTLGQHLRANGAASYPTGEQVTTWVNKWDQWVYKIPPLGQNFPANWRASHPTRVNKLQPWINIFGPMGHQVCTVGKHSGANGATSYFHLVDIFLRKGKEIAPPGSTSYSMGKHFRTKGQNVIPRSQQVTPLCQHLWSKGVASDPMGSTSTPRVNIFVPMGQQVTPCVNLVGHMGLPGAPPGSTFSAQWGRKSPHKDQQVTPGSRFLGANGAASYTTGSTSYPLCQHFRANGAAIYPTGISKLPPWVNIFGLMGQQVRPRGHQVTLGLTR